MTRINLVPPAELCDKHLLAEYRELPRVFALARDCPDAPREYKLGAGHVKFFYDKLGFLQERFGALVEECLRRGFKITHGYPPLVGESRRHLVGGYSPTAKAIGLSRERIKQRLTEMESRKEARTL